MLSFGEMGIFLSEGTVIELHIQSDFLIHSQTLRVHTRHCNIGLLYRNVLMQMTPCGRNTTKRHEKIYIGNLIDKLRIYNKCSRSRSPTLILVSPLERCD